MWPRHDYFSRLQGAETRLPPFETETLKNSVSRRFSSEKNSAPVDQSNEIAQLVEHSFKRKAKTNMLRRHKKILI